jgi:branched chain amino acid aminotransferase apoenzyme (EC 2.6.1.42)
MSVKKVDKIWMNGKLIDWDDAKIHVLSHVIHYGSSWFEGIRCYNTKRGSAVFRLDEHLARLENSTRIYRAEIPYTHQS